MAEDESGRQQADSGAPYRHPINFRDPDYYDESSLFQEMERVFDICHGCRRCFSLCHAFPTLFDLVDDSETMEVDGVAREDYWRVVDHCYLCDMCFMSKCPYVPPHPWEVDFPHLMLRAKAVRHEHYGVKARDRVLSSTDTVGSIAGIPVVAQAVNAANRNGAARKMLESTLGVHRDAPVPEYHSDTLRKRLGRREQPELTPEPTEETTGRVALFGTCYGNRNHPGIGEDLVAVYEHNGIPVRMVEREQCCGMPKLENGDLGAVQKAMEANVPVLAEHVDAGFDIVAPVPSCVLMFRQELPLMFPEDEAVQKVARGIFDPCEYLLRRHKAGKLATDFQSGLGTVAYHAACHQRVQNVGPQTRQLLQVVPDTEVHAIERCSGHDGTYAVKKEFYETSQKICRPVVNRVKKAEPDRYTSDCPMAGANIQHGLGEGEAEHPLSLLRSAYGV